MIHLTSLFANLFTGVGHVLQRLSRAADERPSNRPHRWMNG